LCIYELDVQIREYSMSVLKNLLSGSQPDNPSAETPEGAKNVVELKRVSEDVDGLKESVEGLRFSKRDLAHELVLLVRENSRLEEQVYDMKNRIEKLEALLERSIR